MIEAQKLGHEILKLLKALKELGVDEPTLKSALRAFPNSPGDQMFFILGTLISQGKLK